MGGSGNRTCGTYCLHVLRLAADHRSGDEGPQPDDASVEVPELPETSERHVRSAHQMGRTADESAEITWWRGKRFKSGANRSRSRSTRRSTCPADRLTDCSCVACVT